MFKKYLVLEANAGSGKTFSLVSRYLTLIFMNVSPDKIFALTFTKKATKEMYDRVISSLKDPLKSGEISTIKDDLNLSSDEVIQKSKEALSTLLNSDIKISTIDSFSQSILKKFAHYLDILPNFKVVEKIDEEKFKEHFLEALNGSRYRENLLAVERFDKSVKIEKIFQELQIFYLKEVELYEMKNKFLNLDVYDNLKAIEETILQLGYSIADWLLDDEHNLSKRAATSLSFANFSELTKKSWLYKDRLSEHSDFKKAFKSGDKTTVESAFLSMKQLLEEYFDRQRELIFKNMFQLFEFYVDERENFIKREGKFSFDDINHFLVKLIFDKKLDSKFIYFRLDSRVEHFLIDEFQDTSLLQWRVLEPLASDILSGGSSVDKSFFYVGDKMQSLYRFRGGFSRLFDEIPKDYPQLERETLLNNYRSKEAVVNFVNRVFKTNQSIGNKNQKGGSLYLQEREEPTLGGVDRVLELIELGVSSESIAVICSSNKEIDIVADELEKRGVEVFAETNLSLIEHPPVKAVINYILYLYYIRNDRSSFYLKSFQAVIGVDPKDDCNKTLPFTIETLSLLSLYEIGVKIVEHFHLFDGDENTIRFLEKLQNRYRDIDEFVHNYHLEAGNIGKNEHSGVNIITIHKSKGLEFDHVVFIDFSDRKRGGASLPKTIIHYDGIETKDIVWRVPDIKNRESYLYQRFSDVKEVEDELENEDSFNRLYVALTRAKKTLSIVEREDSSIVKKFGINEEIISQYSGDIENEIEKSERVIEKEEAFILNFEDKHYGYQNENIKIEREEREREKFDLDREWENFKNVQFGNALHSTIEMMDSFTVDSLNVALSNVKNRFSHSLKKDSFESIERRVKTMINSIEFQNLVDGGDILKESSYIFNGKQFYIDMLIEKDDEVIVCDFKSGANHKYHQKYIEQVQNYIAMVRESDIKNRRVSGYLIYPFEEKAKFQKVL